MFDHTVLKGGKDYFTMKCNESIHIRIPDNVKEEVRKQAQTSGISFNKYVSETITEGGSVESRLDKLELKLYELQYVNELQSSFMQESTRVMLSRTSIIIDMLKASGIEQPNSMEKLQTAIKDLDKLINKTKAAITSSSDLWKLDSD